MPNVATMSLAGLGEWLFSHGTTDAYQACLGFVGDTATGTDEEFSSWIAEEPRQTGDLRADALLAAIAEYLAFQRDVPTPLWVHGKGRFLTSAWFPVMLPSIRVRAIVSSPASFWRRLIFIDRSDLQRI